MKNKIIKPLAIIFLALTIVTNGIYMPGAEPLWQGTSNYALANEEGTPTKGDIYPSN